MANSIFYEASKKNKFIKKIYNFYNIYIRNGKFLDKGTQFGEDKYILNLFEKNFKGHFLDIGCFHPTKHNNTYLMYKNGWSGINIDLNPLTIELFDFMRPRDININVGVSDTENEKKLYFIDEFNTQNSLDENQLNFLKNHHNIKLDEIVEKKIKTRRLDKILDEYKYYNIDFMNLDIEVYFLFLKIEPHHNLQYVDHQKKFEG